MLYNGVEWSNIFNVTEIRKRMKKGQYYELVYKENRCVIITREKIFINGYYIDDAFLEDNILYIKIKETID